MSKKLQEKNIDVIKYNKKIKALELKLKETDDEQVFVKKAILTKIRNFKASRDRVLTGIEVAKKQPKKYTMPKPHTSNYIPVPKTEPKAKVAKAPKQSGTYGNGYINEDGSVNNNKNTDNGKYFSYVDAREFFGKEMGDNIIGRCTRNIAVSTKRRRNDLKGYIPYTHFELADFIKYMKEWKANHNSRPKEVQATKALFKTLKPQMTKFRNFLKK